MFKKIIFASVCLLTINAAHGSDWEEMFVLKGAKWGTVLPLMTSALYTAVTYNQGALVDKLLTTAVVTGLGGTLGGICGYHTYRTKRNLQYTPQWANNASGLIDLMHQRTKVGGLCAGAVAVIAFAGGWWLLRKDNSFNFPAF
jgi:hypothetical protein